MSDRLRIMEEFGVEFSEMDKATQDGLIKDICRRILKLEGKKDGN